MRSSWPASRASGWIKDGLWEATPLTRYVAARVPELVIDPKVTGWYRIYAGVYADALDYWSAPRLLARLSGEPYGESLQAPRGTKEHTAQAYWKAADLTGKKIHISQPKGPMPHPGLGISGRPDAAPPRADDRAGSRRQQKRTHTPTSRPAALCDARHDRRNLLERHRGERRRYPRHHLPAPTSGLWARLLALRSALFSTPRWPFPPPHRAGRKRTRPPFLRRTTCRLDGCEYLDLEKRFDPLKVAVDYGRTIGCEVHGMVRFTRFDGCAVREFLARAPGILCADARLRYRIRRRVCARRRSRTRERRIRACSASPIRRYAPFTSAFFKQNRGQRHEGHHDRSPPPSAHGRGRDRS